MRYLLLIYADESVFESYSEAQQAEVIAAYGKLDEELPTIQQPGQMIFQSKRIEGFWLTQWMRRTPLLRKLGVIRSAQTRFANGEWKTDVTAIVPLDEAIARLPAELAVPNGKVFIKPN